MFADQLSQIFVLENIVRSVAINAMSHERNRLISKEMGRRKRVDMRSIKVVLLSLIHSFYKYFKLSTNRTGSENIKNIKILTRLSRRDQLSEHSK